MASCGPGRIERPGTLVGTSDFSELLGRAVERRRMRERREPELRVHVRARRIAVDERDALAELREVDGEVLRDEALADAAASAADGEKPPRSTYAFQVIELDRRRRKAVRHGDAASPAARARPLAPPGATEPSRASRARRSRPKMRAPSSGARNGFGRKSSAPLANASTTSRDEGRSREDQHGKRRRAADRARRLAHEVERARCAGAWRSRTSASNVASVRRALRLLGAVDDARRRGRSPRASRGPLRASSGRRRRGGRARRTGRGSTRGRSTAAPRCRSRRGARRSRQVARRGSARCGSLSGRRGDAPDDAGADRTRRAHVLAARGDEREQAVPVAALERDVRVAGGADAARGGGGRAPARADLEDREHPLAVARPSRPREGRASPARLRARRRTPRCLGIERPRCARWDDV